MDGSEWKTGGLSDWGRVKRSMRKYPFSAVCLFILLIILMGCSKNEAVNGEKDFIPEKASVVTPIVSPTVTPTISPVASPNDGGNVSLEETRWSGLRWVDTMGRTVREHAFDTVQFIQDNNVEGKTRFIIHGYYQGVYSLDPESGDIVELNNKPAEGEGLFLYSFPDTEHYYVVKGRETVYRVDKAEGKQQSIYRTDRPIYGIAASNNGEHIAILVDSDLTYGPYADLIVLDAEGHVESEFAKASYISHSEGPDFVSIYPVKWIDSETIAVPKQGIDSFYGQTLYHYKQGFLESEEHRELSEVAAAILLPAVGKSMDEIWLFRVLPKPDDPERYVAVSLGEGTYIIDLEEKKATLAGIGALMAWTSKGEVLVWHSNEEKYAEYIGLE